MNRRQCSDFTDMISYPLLKTKTRISSFFYRYWFRHVSLLNLRRWSHHFHELRQDSDIAFVSWSQHNGTVFWIQWLQRDALVFPLAVLHDLFALVHLHGVFTACLRVRIS